MVLRALSFEKKEVPYSHPKLVPSYHHFHFQHYIHPIIAFVKVDLSIAFAALEVPFDEENVRKKETIMKKKHDANSI